MTQQWSEDRPTELAPMSLYNEICDWVEEHLGSASLERAGENIGDRAYAQMRSLGTISESSTPGDILLQLKHAADTMIQDPKKRGWEILKNEPNRARLRRTQTFHCILQEGLLRSLVQRAPVRSVTVSHIRCTRRGDEFCEYEVRWI